MAVGRGSMAWQQASCGRLAVAVGRQAAAGSGEKAVAGWRKVGSGMAAWPDKNKNRLSVSDPVMTVRCLTVQAHRPETGSQKPSASGTDLRRLVGR